MIRELARLLCLGLERTDRVYAFAGGAVGGALVMVALHVWPHVLDPIRPR